MQRKPTGDPVLDAEIERAMRPYRDLLPPEMQEVFEDMLVAAYTEDPRGKAIVAGLRERVVPGKSATRAIVSEGGAPNEARPDDASQAGARGGKRGTRGSPGGKGGRR